MVKLTALFFILLSLIIVTCEIFRFFNSRKQEQNAEQPDTEAASAVNIKLNPQLYKVFENISVPADSKNCLLHYVVASVYGIFVIEIKNCDGWIFGNESSSRWTLVCEGRRTRFQNPLTENAWKLKTLSSYLNLPEDKFSLIIFFTGEAVFKSNMPHNVLRKNLHIYINAQTKRIIAPAELETVLMSLNKRNMFT